MVFESDLVMCIVNNGTVGYCWQMSQLVDSNSVSRHLQSYRNLSSYTGINVKNLFDLLLSVRVMTDDLH